jgi:hypothetical protein
MPTRFERRLVAIRAERPALRRQAERLALEHFRTHRDLPCRAIVALIPRRRLYGLICRGEIEHRLRVAKLLLHASALRDRAMSWMRAVGGWRK